MSSLFEQALDDVRASRSDLSIRPDRWDTRWALPLIEQLLRDPLRLPDVSGQWARRLSETTSSSDLMHMAAGWLRDGEQSSELPVPQDMDDPAFRRLPFDVAAPLSAAWASVAQAQRLLDQAVGSLSAGQRRAALAAWQAALTNHEDDADWDAGIETSGRFDLASLLNAAEVLTQGLDKTLPALQRSGWIAGLSEPVRIHTGLGDILLAGGAEQDFVDDDLKDVVLLVNHSDRSLYRGPVAAGTNGRIRAVIDFAPTITVNAADTSASAGAGILGIGLFYAPNPDGIKTFHTGNFSLGAGLFGVGGLFLNSSQTLLEGLDGTQGVGCFGIGILSNPQASGSVYRARFAGQGVGFTRGVGFLQHDGSDSLFEGGLYYPDPREPLALTSLCQGV
ncbi:MAG TPA: hypothetical protein VMU17_05130, partial [Elusimicrobiota bacterium]|nr:hypothetical protein [Elusimicrobiota bacterium]